MRDSTPWRTFSLLIVLATPAFVGCSLFTGSENTEPVYSTDADKNIKQGQEALSNRHFVEAAKYFEYVRTKFPFLEAAKQAELLLADADFAHDQFIEARDRYEGFVKLHPTHPKVDYAAFRAALTHYKEIPSDFFVLPPPHEKDQSAERGALRSMNDFIRRYPHSSYIQEAQTVRVDTEKRLARHEQYVADFYTKRKRWPAVIGRLETLVSHYPGTGLDADAYLELHDVYETVGDREKASDALERLVVKCPGTPQAARAEQMLQKN